MELKLWIGCFPNHGTFPGTEKHYLKQKVPERWFLFLDIRCWTRVRLMLKKKFSLLWRVAAENSPLLCSALPDYHIICPPLFHQGGQRAVLASKRTRLAISDSVAADL